MYQFITEIRTGKRHINPAIIKAYDFILFGSIIILGLIMTLEIIGIDLIGLYA